MEPSTAYHIMDWDHIFIIPASIHHVYIPIVLLLMGVNLIGGSWSNFKAKKRPILFLLAFLPTAIYFVIQS
ncbi:hypothetical protein [Paracerasibacillus soli]|uniref:Cytochrome oxidase subunit I profile domain-containing protein n=1 Tax=Paracerasibacillus soli TaxID=480284 RepID=A0ABU5CTM3_9BACI|nr:hypothetical protein [Virgibacillus soli]MDY0409697.1 hypothetical protein [Virgibacillus soli]